MRHCSSDISVIVLEVTGDISPINLAAALADDNPEKDIYLMVDELSVSLSSRAHAAGIRRLINHEQALEMLSVALRPSDSQEQRDYLRRHGSTKSPESGSLKKTAISNEPVESIQAFSSKQAASIGEAQLIQEVLISTSMR